MSDRTQSIIDRLARRTIWIPFAIEIVREIWHVSILTEDNNLLLLYLLLAFYAGVIVVGALEMQAKDLE